MTPALLKDEWGWGQCPTGQPDPGNQYPPYHWLLSFPSFVSVLFCGSEAFLLVSLHFLSQFVAHFAQLWHIFSSFNIFLHSGVAFARGWLRPACGGWSLDDKVYIGQVLTYANGSSSVHNYSRNVAQWSSEATRDDVWAGLQAAGLAWHLIWNNYSYPGIFCNIAAGPDTLHASITPSSYKYTTHNIQLNILQISSPQQFPSLSDASEHLFYLRQQSIIRLPGAPIWEVFKRSMWNDKCRIVLWILNHFNRLVNWVSRL